MASMPVTTRRNLKGPRLHLGARMLAVFAVAAALVVAGIVSIVPIAVDRLVEDLMERHARSIIALERRAIETMAKDGSIPLLDGRGVAPVISDELRGLAVEPEIATSFAIDSIFIVAGDRPLKVFARDGSAASPPSASILAQARAGGGITLHRMDPAMARSMGGLIDVIAPLGPGIGSGALLDLRLDFAESFAMHRAQFAWFEYVLIIGTILVEAGQALILLGFVRRSAIEPALAISKAMEAVAAGDLEPRLETGSDDEFGMMAGRFNDMVLALRQKARMSRYVSVQTLAMIHGDEGGLDWRPPARKERAVLFSDVRGFTAFSETHEPELVIETLNCLLSVQAEAVVACGGEIDKFVGDALMATFSGPRAATICALRIQRLLASRPEGTGGLLVGIGIANGIVVEGDLGGPRRKDFTIIGDTVNTAARLESIAGEGEVLAPESMMTLPSMRPFLWEHRGEQSIKGKRLPLSLVAITGTGRDSAGPRLRSAQDEARGPRHIRTNTASNVQASFMAGQNTEAEP